jgi:hypothetical protein
MTQTNAAIIVAIKPWMKYAKLCMSMRSATPAIRLCAGVGGLPYRAALTGRRGIGSGQRCGRPSAPSSRGGFDTAG